MVKRLALLFLAMIICSGPARSAEQITLASTTSTENSGLLAWLLPKFEADSGIRVRVIAVGTGQALRLARNGDADVLLTHARAREEAFVAEGWGVERLPLMYNDFVIIGPRDDPAGIGDIKDVGMAFSSVASGRHPFVSRGDESGTHFRELELWRMAGQEPEAGAAWYREMGSGMGATLNAAVAMDAYTLTDRATWLSFGNRGDMTVLVEGHPTLFNQYAVIQVNPNRHPHVRAQPGAALIRWLVGAEGQIAIGEFRLHGQQVFFQNAGTYK